MFIYRCQLKAVRRAMISNFQIRFSQFDAFCAYESIAFTHRFQYSGVQQNIPL